MKDHVRCYLPLPLPGANDVEYSMWDSLAAVEDDYAIRADGTLWRNTYNRVWGDGDPPDPPHWEFVPITRELRLYGTTPDGRDWLWSIYLVDGVVRALHQVDSDWRRMDGCADASPPRQATGDSHGPV